MKPMILASASPRRRELMTLAGYSFRVLASSVDEEKTGQSPAEIVENLSRQKAEAVALSLKEDCIIIGCDTLVCLNDRIMGKPKDEEDAFEMLSSLSGTVHQVRSGVTILDCSASGISRSVTFHETTDVHVVPMTPDEIRSYIACGESMDKAGAYAIQGRFSLYISGICGDYYNVMGLPVCRLHKELTKMLSGSC